MKREQAENAAARLEQVCRNLMKLSALLEQGTPPTPAITADALRHNVTSLGFVARVLSDEVAAMAKYAKNYRTTVQHGEDQPILREAYARPATAIRAAKQAYGVGATVAEVRRATDGVVIYDGPAEIELDSREW